MYSAESWPLVPPRKSDGDSKVDTLIKVVAFAVGGAVVTLVLAVTGLMVYRCSRRSKSAVSRWTR